MSDIVSIGAMGEDARRARTGDVVTFARVAVLDSADSRAELGDAGEVRVTGTPGTVDEARLRVSEAAARAGGVPVTAFALHDLLRLSGRDQGALESLAETLVAAGATAVSEVCLDATPDDNELAGALRVLARAGLGAWRATVGEANVETRLALIERVVALQSAGAAFRAFAPLPRQDPADAPSTGYDDVKTVAIARLWCEGIERIQVDWPLYGPKLAQVAVTFGANDIDGVQSFDAIDLGPRRSSLEDIRRQIAAAGGRPVERDARYVERS
jgi:aminodeoxyfutalosine synthase